MKRLTLGIDVGITGALAIVDESGGAVMVEDLPTIARGKNARVKHELDPAGLCHLLKAYAPDIQSAWVEQIASMPGQGVASIFSLGHSLGAVEGALAAMGIPTNLVIPRAWKIKAGLPNADKEEARALAVRLFPTIPLHRKADHNMAEALLIARHGWLQSR